MNPCFYIIWSIVFKYGFPYGNGPGLGETNPAAITPFFTDKLLAWAIFYYYLTSLSRLFISSGLKCEFWNCYYWEPFPVLAYAFYGFIATFFNSMW